MTSITWILLLTVLLPLHPFVNYFTLNCLLSKTKVHFSLNVGRTYIIFHVTEDQIDKSSRNQSIIRFDFGTPKGAMVIFSVVGLPHSITRVLHVI